MATSREVLVIRGRLDRAGLFTLQRSRSTPFVRQWPIVEKCEIDVTVELLDRGGEVLHREAAEVRPEIGCEPGGTQTYRVTAYIGLRDDAAFVRLMRRELQLWREAIPAPATLDVKLSRAAINRRAPVRLRLGYSPPGEAAHITVVYKWGPRRFRPIYIGPPKDELSLNLRDLPGGDDCRLVVTYSNGLRSAHAATPRFRMPLLGPTVTVVRPNGKTPIVARTPVILEGMAYDPERAGGAQAADVVWLVDGQQVATGLIASVDGLEAGRHRVTLAYRAQPGGEASVTVRVEETKVPTADDWTEWDSIAGNN